MSLTPTTSVCTTSTGWTRASPKAAGRRHLHPSSSPRHITSRTTATRAQQHQRLGVVSRLQHLYQERVPRVRGGQGIGIEIIIRGSRAGTLVFGRAARRWK